MKITVLTVCPAYFSSFLTNPLVERAKCKANLDLRIVDITSYAKGSFRHLDDSVYGGGVGMVLKCEPVIEAIRRNKTPNTHVILFDPSAYPYTQQKARKLVTYEDVMFVCGHYEGFDRRIYDEVDERISIGDYILSGGELASMVVIDSMVRLMDGVLKEEASKFESYETHRLECDQYTRPYAFEGKCVPDVLLSGDHEKIAQWRKKSALLNTMQYRKDLIDKYPLTSEEKELLKEEES